MVVTIVYGFSFAMIKIFKVEITDIGSNSFLIGYLGVLLGFALTLFTFIISMVEKITESLSKIGLPQEKIDEKQEMLDYFVRETKENIVFIFVSFVAVGVCILYEKIDIPFISLNDYKDFITKEIMIKAFKLTIFLLSLYAIYDMMIVSFKISVPASLIDKTSK